MKYIATPEAFKKLNMYKMTELEVVKEFNDLIKLDETHVIDPRMFFNTKNKDLSILPLGKKTAFIFVIGQELERSYEDMPEVKFKGDKWILK